MNHSYIECDLPYTPLFNINDIIPKFRGTRLDPEPISNIIQHTYSDPTGELHWQYYPYSRVYISRNLLQWEPMLCINISNYMRELQDHYNAMPHDDPIRQHPLVAQLLDHTVLVTNITLLWTPLASDTIIMPHIDHRSLAINIGLQNSHYGTTIVSNTPNIDTWDTDPKTSYTMQDNRVYLLNTHHAHSVISNVTNSDIIDRYMISYCIK